MSKLINEEVISPEKLKEYLASTRRLIEIIKASPEKYDINLIFSKEDRKRINKIISTAISTADGWDLIEPILEAKILSSDEIYDLAKKSISKEEKLFLFDKVNDKVKALFLLESQKLLKESPEKNVLVLLRYINKNLNHYDDLISPEKLGEIIALALNSKVNIIHVNKLISITEKYSSEELYKLLSQEHIKGGKSIFTIAAAKNQIKIFQEFFKRLNPEQVNSLLIENSETIRYLLYNKKVEGIKLILDSIISMSDEYKNKFINLVTSEVDKLHLEIRDESNEEVKKIADSKQNVHAGDFDKGKEIAFKMLESKYTKITKDEEAIKIIDEMLKEVSELRKRSTEKGYTGPSLEVLNGAESFIINIIKNPDMYVSSKTKKLVALVWIAASDANSLIISEPLTTKKQLSENLKEAIFYQLHDSGNAYGPGHPSCIPGMENRIFSVLSGYYPDIFFNYGVKKEVNLDVIKPGHKDGEVRAQLIIKGKLREMIEKKEIDEILDLVKNFQKFIAPVEQKDTRWKNLWNQAADSFLSEGYNENLVDYIKLKSIQDQVTINPIDALEKKLNLDEYFHQFAVIKCGLFKHAEDFKINESNKAEFILLLKEKKPKINWEQVLDACASYLVINEKSFQQQYDAKLMSTIKNILESGKKLQSKILADELAGILISHYSEKLPETLLKDPTPKITLRNMLESICKQYLQESKQEYLFSFTKIRQIDKFTKIIADAISEPSSCSAGKSRY